MPENAAKLTLFQAIELKQKGLVNRRANDCLGLHFVIGKSTHRLCLANK